MDTAVRVLERIHHVVAGNAPGSPEPAQLGHGSVARHDTDPAVALQLVHPMIAASLQAFKAALKGEKIEVREANWYPVR